ncbi:uncharacterized protein LOC132038130 [Lycium ferocissimum]|uniref:uncharacterized protein LOC132038130 n=1 Tax=Lycium ferocissimum TaxID=112874 RepID=UPI0028160897|nr:uncharacterized protein LOC132038130 [Lycium ferocissimum]
MVMQIWGGRWVRSACLEASGTRGGIMMMWDSRIWKGEILEVGTYTLTCKFEAQLQNFSCHITGVYAPNNCIERRLVWEEIGSVRGLMEGPWAVCGDFHATRFISEKRNCVRSTRGMREFSDFIEYMNLVDLQLEDATFTWFKGDNQETASRIDRILISEEWDDSFSNLKQVHLQRLISDHVPIALQGGSWNKNKNYFKFENWWLGTKVACKLKALKTKLKEWSKSEHGNLGSQRKNLLRKMVELDAVLEDRMLTEEETVRKASMLMEYEELIKNEEISWRQRSISLWLKEGDRNMKFSHKMANAHKRYNNIDQLLVEGELTQDPLRLKKR